jgi:hypothetical protein
MSAAPEAVLFDWLNPDYAPVWAQRMARLRHIRAHPQDVPLLRQYYRSHPAEWAAHWWTTFDPRLLADGKPALVPFIPWPKQEAAFEFMHGCWVGRQNGCIVKSRDVGMTTCATAQGAHWCIFHDNFALGIASATEVKLDRSGDPGTIFAALRLGLSHLPREFSGGWTLDKCSAYMRLWFPNGSSITGEAGDAAGRGSRKSVYYVDEAAWFEHPDLIDASLSATTDVRIDISSVNGIDNSFYQRAHNPQIRRFDIRWTDDPRKDAAWYTRKSSELGPLVTAQEIDCNFAASVDGAVIPVSWINAAIDADVRLGIQLTGSRFAALDVSDIGGDRCAFVARFGIRVDFAKSWSGKDSTIYGTTMRAIGYCDDFNLNAFFFDADGLGAGVRGDCEAISEQRSSAGRRPIMAHPYRGSGAVREPKSQMVNGRRNIDFFLNLKSQSWWSLRLRFERTFKAVVEGLPIDDPDDLISLDPSLPELNALIAELSGATYAVNATGKIQINKLGDGRRSPNLADALVICFSPATWESRMWSKL